MALAYFPLYPTDFEADTAHLTLAEDGAYNRLLRLCWRTPGCSIPADREWIYRRMRAATDEDRAVVDAVLDEFFSEREHRYSNARLTREFFAAKAAHERRVLAGSKGGKAKALTTNDSDPSNATAKPKQPEPELEPEPTVVGAAVSGDEKTHREDLLKVIGADPVSGLTGPNGTVIGTVADMEEVAKWSAAGISETDQIRIVKERMAERRAKMPDFMPKSLRYFSDAMSEFVSRRAEPLPKASPKARGDTDRDKNLAFYKRAGRKGGLTA